MFHINSALDIIAFRTDYMKKTNSTCLAKYQLENAKCIVGTRQLASREL